MGCANGTAAAGAAPYDPAFAASQSWLDISGATAYDRVFVRLAVGPGNGRVMAEVEGSGCDNCGRFLFRRDIRIGMLAYCRKNGCKEVLLTLDKQSSESSRFPIPEVHEGWVEHTVLVERHSVDGVHTYREPALVVELRAGRWEEKLAKDDPTPALLNAPHAKACAARSLGN